VLHIYIYIYIYDISRLRVKHPEQCLIADISSRSPGFSPIAVYVGFVVDKLETFFPTSLPEHLKFPCQLSFHDCFIFICYGLVQQVLPEAVVPGTFNLPYPLNDKCKNLLAGNHFPSR